MGCAECVCYVQKALSDIPGIKKTFVFLAAETAVLQSDRPEFDMGAVHVDLAHQDWRQVPYLFRISRRPKQVVGKNLGFTAACNVIGIALAVFGVLPPIKVAAAQ